MYLAALPKIEAPALSPLRPGLLYWPPQLAALLAAFIVAAGVNPSYSFLIQRAACKATSVGGSSVPSTNPPEEKNERNFSTRHCSLRPTPHITKYWQAAACPRELPKNRRRTEVSVLYSGSPGAVGRHNNTPNRVAFGCVCHKHPPPSSVRALLVVRDPSPKGDSLAHCFNLKGSGCPKQEGHVIARAAKYRSLTMNSFRNNDQLSKSAGLF